MVNASEITYFVEDSVNGLLTGGIYALIALGIVFVFRATKVFNFAHGAIIMIGAYIFFSISFFFEYLGLSLWSLYLIILPISVLISAVFGMFIEKTIMRPMMGQHPFALIMVTIGLISVLEGFAAIIWTSAAHYPIPLVPLNIDFISGVAINRQMLFSCIIAILIFGVISLFFIKSKIGIAIRATASDQSTAYAMGINIGIIFSIAWVIASISGAFAGILISPLNSLTPSLGAIGLSVISVVILGGLDSVLGVFIAAFIVGWVESMVNHYLGGSYKEIVPYVIVLLIILIRPFGLMGAKDIDRL